MTPEQLASLAGILLSLGFAYIPGLETRFYPLGPKDKAAIMGLCLVLAAVIVFAVGCFQLGPVVFTCDKPGAVELFSILVSALVANQSAYWIAVRPMKKGSTLSAR